MRRILTNSYLALLFGFLYLPILIVIVYSFNDARFSTIWHGFTWHWYAALWQNSDLLLAAWHSTLLGIISASVASMMGTLIAIQLFRYQFLGKTFLRTLLFALIVIPDIVLGIALLMLVTSLHLKLGFWTLLIAHITFCIPFATVLIASRLNSLDRSLLDAAKDLGASELQILFKIIVPLILPGLIAGWLLSLTLSLDDVIISYFMTGPSFDVLPLKIYSMVRLGVKPEINALCTLILILTIGLVLVAQRLLREK